MSFRVLTDHHSPGCFRIDHSRSFLLVNGDCFENLEPSWPCLEIANAFQGFVILRLTLVQFIFIVFFVCLRQQLLNVQVDLIFIRLVLWSRRLNDLDVFDVQIVQKLLEFFFFFEALLEISRIGFRIGLFRRGYT